MHVGGCILKLKAGSATRKPFIPHSSLLNMNRLAGAVDSIHLRYLVDDADFFPLHVHEERCLA